MATKNKPATMSEAIEIMTRMAAESVPTAKTVKTTVKSCDIKHEGVEIILPNINGVPMSYKEAIEWLKRKELDEEQIVHFHHQFVCSPLDGAVAFQKALEKTYGFTQLVMSPAKSFFDSDRPPAMVGVPINAEESMQVPLGRIQIPGIDGWLEAGCTDRPKPMFAFGGEVKKKFEKQIKQLAEETRRILKDDSIYRGKAIKISWKWQDDDERFDPIEHAPKFMELANVDENDLIFSKDTINDLTIGLFTPIEQSGACRSAGIPLKRGVLLYGPYGTGKTMTAYVSAKKAVRSGWTFVYLDNVKHLKQGLDFAAQYAPCVLFAEDVDRVMTGDRSINMDEILNTLDGVDTKGAEIITVFTTNHIEKINPATLRMGRLDTLVHVTPPDAQAVEKLVRLYSRDLLEPGADLTKIGQNLEGQIPAFIREVTERAKISAIARTGLDNIKGKVLEEDLLIAAKAMEPHADLLKPKKTDLDLSNCNIVTSVANFKRVSGVVPANGNGKH